MRNILAVQLTLSCDRIDFLIRLPARAMRVLLAIAAFPVLRIPIHLFGNAAINAAREGVLGIIAFGEEVMAVQFRDVDETNSVGERVVEHFSHLFCKLLGEKGEGLFVDFVHFDKLPNVELGLVDEDHVEQGDFLSEYLYARVSVVVLLVAHAENVLNRGIGALLEEVRAQVRHVDHHDERGVPNGFDVCEHRLLLLQLDLLAVEDKL